MEWTKILVDNGLHLTSLAILGFMGWAFKKAFLEPIEQIKKELMKHIEECERIPKSVIIERLDNLKEDVKQIQDITVKYYGRR